MNPDLRRAFAFERELLRGAAGRAETLPWGEALLTPELPLVHDLNMVIVDQPVNAAEPVLTATEELLGSYVHRKLRVEDPKAAALLRPALEAGGWSADEHVAMVLRSGDVAPPRTTVEELDIDTYRQAEASFVAEEPWGSPPVAEQLAARLGRHARTVTVRCFGVQEQGAIVAGAQLLVDGDGRAEVDGVHVLLPHRGRGFGRDVTAAAVHAARQHDCSFVFLLADADDWPLQLYGRMGFETVGSVALFQRLVDR